MADMTFGDQAFLCLMRDSNYDYEKSYPVVDAVIRPFVFRKIQGREELGNDLMQEIHVAVWQNLPRFCQQAEHYTPGQRLGWLYTLADHKCQDLFRAERVGKTDWKALEDCPLAAPESNPEDQLLREEQQEELERRVDDLLQTACAMRSAPENTLAFLYNRVIMPLESAHAKKGDNRWVEETLWDLPLETIRRRLGGDLSAALGRELPEAVLQPLDRRLRQRGNVPFRLSAREIASGSYSVSNALRKQKMLRPEDQTSSTEASGLSKKKFLEISLIIRRFLRFI